MEKKIFILLIPVFFCSTGFSLGQDIKAEKFKENNRQLLKEMFLTFCIVRGFPDKYIEFSDHSLTVYGELACYEIEVPLKIDSLATAFVTSIPYSDYEGTHTRGVIAMSLEYYHSNELDSIVRSMDKYMADYEYYEEE